MSLDHKGEAIRAALKALERQGRLTPDEVLAAARDQASPLHDSFEWDEAKAAHAHRLDQARSLIRSVMVVVTVEDRKLSTVTYVRDPVVAAAEQGYVSLEQLRTEPTAAHAMLMLELVRIEGCLRRAQDLADVLGMGALVQTTAKRVARLRRRIEMQPPV